MTLEYIHGKMDVCMKGSTGMIRNMGTEYTLGLTRKDTQVGGIKVNNMV
jgi:hypothetical protein